MQHVYVSKRLLRIIRKQYQWIIEEELHNIETKKRAKNNFLGPREVPACNLDWPVCTDVLEKSKQKKRNTSMFSLRADRGKAPKTNYLTTEFKHTHHHKNQLLKKKLKNKERGRDRQIKIDIAPEHGKHLMKGYDSKQNEKEAKNNQNNEINEGNKYSENPFIVQNHLVIGRHKHTCQELQESIKSSKKQPSMQKRERTSRMEEYVKDSLADVRDERSPFPMRIMKCKTETQIPQITYQTIPSSQVEKSNEKKEGGGVSSLLRGLFGGAFMMKSETEIKTKKKKGGQNVSSSSEEEINSPKILVRKGFMDNEEDTSTRNKPKKSIYNYLMEQDLDDFPEKNVDSKTKSIQFMRAFFKDER